MGAISDFFNNVGTRLGGSILPGSYLQAQGIDPQTAQALQRGSVNQFGLGLLSSIGTGQAFGPRIGHAFQYAAGTGQDVAQQVARLGEARARDQQQASQFAQTMGLQQKEVGLREQQLGMSRDQFNTTEKRLGEELTASIAHQKAMEGIQAKGVNATAANEAAQAAARVNELRLKTEGMQRYRAILDDGRPFSDPQKQLELQFEGQKFMPAPNPLSYLFGPQGLQSTPPAQPGQPAAPATDPIMDAYRRGLPPPGH